MRTKLIGWILSLCLVAGLTACSSPVSPSSSPVPQAKDLSIAMDRATKTVDVTGDVGPFTLTVGANTVNDADGLDISLAGLNLSSAALTGVTVTSAGGSTTFGAIAPLAAATANQEGVKAKLKYAVYALSAVYNSNADRSAGIQQLISDFENANTAASGYVVDETTAIDYNDNCNLFTDYVGVPAALAAANSTYILPNMAAIMAYYNANPAQDLDADGVADAVSFQENMLKVWWNKLDTSTTNDAALNTLIETQIKAIYPDVNSVL